jgi:hypothetical protein
VKNYFSGFYSINAGWNLISVPKTVADYHKSVLFPSAVSPAYQFNGGYQALDSLGNGTGYWLKFGTGQYISYIGAPRLVDTIDVVDRWNLIGSIGEPVDVSSITQIPPGIVSSQYFGFSGGYQVATTIQPGKAYWVKTNGGGRLVLSAQIAVIASEKEDPISKDLENMGVLSISQTGNDGTAQKLYIGKDLRCGVGTDYFEMPPKPPAGALDVRFASNRSVELVGEEIAGTREIPLSIQATGEPLQVKWNQKNASGMRYSFVEKSGKEIIHSQLLGEGNALTISPVAGHTYSITVETIPATYSLAQNYPNPFNPATRISYTLPVESKVTLKVFNILGQEVLSLIDGIESAGYKAVEFHGSDLASGVYFYRIDASPVNGKKSSFTEVKKMMLVK